MYKLCYYRFADATQSAFGRRGWDRVRNVDIGRQDISLKYFEEVFTTEHWMVRIYKVRDRCGALLWSTIVCVILAYGSHLRPAPCMALIGQVKHCMVSTEAEVGLDCLLLRLSMQSSMPVLCMPLLGYKCYYC